MSNAKPEDPVELRELLTISRRAKNTQKRRAKRAERERDAARRDLAGARALLGGIKRAAPLWLPPDNVAPDHEDEARALSMMKARIDALLARHEEGSAQVGPEDNDGLGQWHPSRHENNEEG